ncbi:MAG: hypothetical protein HKP27_08525 [Myxococcales bacterium]|nr:hypothetical protein [Myxococcales bacterium]
MARVSALPVENLSDDLRDVMLQYDEELGGSGFVRVLAHAPETFQSFIDYYFPLVSETRGRIDMRLTELTRLKVAERNDCDL